MTKSKIISSYIALVSCVFALGCSNESEEIGGNDPVQTKSGLAAYAGDWEGYAEGYYFNDNTDLVRFTVDETGNGIIRFGSTELLAPPTDPEATFPPDALEYIEEGIRSGDPRFEYPLHDVIVESERLRAAFSPVETFADWCALQTPRPASLSETGYYCFSPGSNFTLQSDGLCYAFPTPLTLDELEGTELPPYEVPCAQLFLCDFCSCSAEQCVANTAAYTPDRIDGVLDQTQQKLTGTLSLNGEEITVHLTRQE